MASSTQAPDSCLEKEANKKPTEIASGDLLYPIECKKPRPDFVKMCRPTWVKHFDSQYCEKNNFLQRMQDPLLVGAIIALGCISYHPVVLLLISRKSTQIAYG